MNNAEQIVAILQEASVRWVFGIPSGPVLPLIDALRQSDVEFVLTASETSAGFMASTVGHLTGKPGVCVATVGPGATNLATGVGAAWLDRAPVLAITCNVATPWLERRIQMRIDHHALFDPLSKATLPLRADTAGQTMWRALALATAEPPGPVHLDLPEDVGLAPAALPPAGRGKVGQRVLGLPAPLDAEDSFDAANSLIDIADQVEPAVTEALATSRHPLVVTGLTFTRSRARESLLRFVERHGIPFVTTLHAKGYLPESHPLCAGVIGRARRTDVQAFVDRADLILALGYDPIEINYEEWVRSTPVLHVSTEPAEPGDFRLLLNAAGDLDGALGRLSQIPTTTNDWTPADLGEHRERLQAALRPPDVRFALHHVLDTLRMKLPPDGVLTYDVGAHTHQIATQWRTDWPATCLATNGWSSMGYGMPSAYAAKLVYPDRPVVAVVGDGGFQMTVGELTLARRLNLAVPVIVLNDGWLGLMKVKQERRGYELHGVHLGNPPPSPEHYFGVPCRGVHDAEGLAEALDWALALSGPSVIEAFIDVEPYSTTVYD